MGHRDTRPTIPEVFQSPVTIQVTTAADISTGVGKVIFDQPAGKARARYAFRSGPRDEIITRYDLGAIFRSDPTGCDVSD